MIPLVVVTRTRDRPRLLVRAIHSVLKQSFPDWHHVIVNDGGDAAALERLFEPFRARYGNRLTILHLDESVGMQNAANRGISALSSEFITLHDDDDSWSPDFLAACVDFLRREGPDSAYQGVITGTELVEEVISAEGRIEERTRQPYIPLSEISLFRMGFQNPFPPIAFCFRRTAWDTLGGFDPRFSVVGDYDFNFRFLQRFEIGVLPQVSAFYHVRLAASDPSEANSVIAGKEEHKVRYNELHNHYLRGGGTSGDPFHGLALNLSRYLVEIEWAVHEARNRTARIEEGLGELQPRLDQLEKAVGTHANNLWTDLNTRAREIVSALEATSNAQLAENLTTRGQIAELERKIDGFRTDLRAEQVLLRLGRLVIRWRRPKEKPTLPTQP